MMQRRRWAMLALAADGVFLGPAAVARDSLGMFGHWGAFRDAAVPRCYAIARATNGRHGQAAGALPAYADIASWPRRGLRSQVHFHLSRPAAAGPQIVLLLGGQRIALAAVAGDAWLADARRNAAVVAAMRAAPMLRIIAHDRAHRRFVDSWPLAGAASAIDAATLGCAGLS